MALIPGILPIVLILLCLTLHSRGEVARQQALQRFFQSESVSLSHAQKSIEDFLVSKKIPINGKAGSLRKISSQSSSKFKIATSTPENPLECRISLGKVEYGRKCIAPCACTGSQQWITFAEFNRLRRKEPTQWNICRTCQQKIEVGELQNYSGIIICV